MARSDTKPSGSIPGETGEAASCCGGKVPAPLVLPEAMSGGDCCGGKTPAPLILPEAKGGSSCCGGKGHAHESHAHHGHGQSHAEPGHGMAIDPVCHMQVNPETTPHHADHEGEAYHFCSAGCRTKFLADPERYRDPEAAAAAAAAEAAAQPEGTVFTCPMHPEIRQVGPGSCPICGMALEPELVTLDSGPNPELADMSRRFWIGLALTLPVFLLEMGGHLAGGHGLIDPGLSRWVQATLATPVVLWAGWPFFERGWASLVTRNLNMFTLVALGTGAASIYSVVATPAPTLFPPAFRDPHGLVGVYFEAASVIIVLVLLGQVLELRARDRTSNAIKALLGLAPKTARRLAPDGTENEVPLDALQVGTACACGLARACRPMAS